MLLRFLLENRLIGTEHFNGCLIKIRREREKQILSAIEKLNYSPENTLVFKPDRPEILTGGSLYV